MSRKKKQKKQSNKQFTPKTTAESIPYLYVYQNSIIEISPGRYSKSYIFPDANFKTTSRENQIRILEEYSKFLTALDPSVDVQVTLYNKTVDISEFQEEVLLEMKPDKLNKFREEYNNMLLEKMTGAKNNLQTQKILTLTINANGIDEAAEEFAQLDMTITESMTEITKYDAKRMELIDRLEILNSIYNQDAIIPLYDKKNIGGQTVESFSLENCAKQGITTKDVIAPSGLEFSVDHIKIGSAYAKTYYISNYPTWLKGDMLTDLSKLPVNMLISAYIKSIRQEEAVKLVKKQRTNIGASIVDKQKKAAQSGIDASLISPDLAEAHTETDNLIQNITKDDGRLFTVSVFVTLFASDIETLNNYEKQLKMAAAKNLITVKAAGIMMEPAFNSSLPLGNKQLPIERLMTSDSISAFNPFYVKDVRQKNGIYYGLNATSRNMLIYDRTTDLNPNACILGMPGAGKSFTAKKELISVLLSSATADDEIYVIDPEGEYERIADAFGGSTIKLTNGADLHINPFDLNTENSEDGGDPVKIKTDFIESIAEIMIGGRYGLSAIQISIINRCVISIYEDYIEHLKKTGKTIDPDACPTMETFYDALNDQPQIEAQDLALSLERYVKGAQDIFSHRTNVNINNRFTVFNIKDIGTGLKELGLHICLDHIWNRMILNKSKGKRTWIYIDEFHVLLQKESSAAYIANIWKRARKWGGIPTAITQNVEDMLKTEDSRSIINTSSFLILLGQSPLNKEELSRLLNISREEQKYISTAKPGMGLIRIKEDIIPLQDDFPKNTELYKILTTKPDEQI